MHIISYIPNDPYTPRANDPRLCSCDEPEFEADDNNFRFCVVCGKEDRLNDVDFSPSEPPDDVDIW